MVVARERSDIHRGTKEVNRNNYKDFNILNENIVRKKYTIYARNGTQKNKQD
jgi:hypothetical protein